MKKNFALGAAVVAILAAPSAFANDRSPFAGAYAGVQLSLAELDSKHTDVDYWFYNAKDQSNKDTGVQIGLKAGYDLVHGAVLAGVLAEVQLGKLDSFAETRPEDEAYAIGTKLSFLGSLRAKLGVTSGKLAAFATGGVAFTDSDQKYRETDSSGEYFDGKGDRTGYVLGVGAAYAVSDNASIGIDLSRYKFGTRSHDLIDDEGYEEDYRFAIKDKIDQVSVSYNLRF